MLRLCEMTLCDQDEKYRFASGRPGRTAPATIFMRLLVAMPLPYREYRIVDWSQPDLDAWR